jgi:nucleoporin GLE1
MQKKCIENKDVFNKSFIESIQFMVKDIDQELKSETKNSSELILIEEKYLKLSKETNEKLEIKITDHLKAKIKKEKEEKDKRNQEKYLEEIQKYKTKYIEVKKFLEHLIKDKLESKKNTINSLANKQLNEKIDDFELTIKSHINDVDSYVSKTFEKNMSIVVADQKEAELDKIFANLSENLDRYIRIGRDYENKLANLITAIQNIEKSKEKEQNLKLAEEKKKAEQAKQETIRLEQEKQHQEEALRIANTKKQEEEAATAAKKASEISEKLETVKNVNVNDKNGINALTLSEFDSNRIFFDKIRNEVETTLGEQSLKMYKFELQKAINFPLNSLLDDKTNEENVRNFNDKIRTFIRLLSGQTCAITSTLVVNPTRHPCAIDFCLVYLAKQIVEKAAETVSSRPETSFQYAQLIKDVFKQNSQFETILIGQMQEKCPFTVPFYKPRLQNQNENEYFESLGYKLVNGKVEDEILYYKRMNGILHLYFTLLMNTSNINKNNYQQTTNHFTNGYKKAWQWLSDVLNMTPRPDITAEMLAIFFKCCGFQMQRIYGKQFLKLTNVCLNDFFPLIRSIPAGKQSGASIGRLQTVFDDFKRNNQFSEWKN